MHAKVRELDSLLRRLERPGGGHSRVRVSTGCAPLNSALPGQGFLRGSLVEWLEDGPGCGAGVLALRAAGQACREGGALVVIDPQHYFYPPAAVAGGVDLQQTIVVRATQPRQSQWSLDQALRCPQVAAVVAWPERLDSRAFRRLQLAVETSGCLGLLVRPAAAQRESSWADVRFLVSPVAHVRDGGRGQASPADSSPAESTIASWRLKVELLRCRGGSTQRTVDLELDERTGDIHATHPGNLVTQLADSTRAARQARA